MSKVAILLDGKEVFVNQGSNLLEAALTHGFDVPHLCYDPRLKPFGSCRLCFVEVEGRPVAVPACGTQVSEGMRVTTNSERVAELRRIALEFLLSEHCGDCVAPCQHACPAEIDIQGFIAHIGNGQNLKAAALIKEKLPLPSVCGRVCPRFCEAECRRNILDGAVNICALKRFAGDYDLKALTSYVPQVQGDSCFSVAVVGGGPAGLTAAYYLALSGHRVTLFDAGPKLGGMLRYGIPEYRLPKLLLDQEIKLITDLCQEVRLGEVFGRDYTLADLKEGYDAVFLGIGCQSAQGLGLDNEEMPGILKGIDFLRMVSENRAPQLGRKVAVVGGGNTAMDAARTALRLGAEDVVVIYRRSKEEMPASPIEILEAEEEGVEFRFLTNPTLCLPQDGRLAALECICMELGEPDSSNRRRPVAIQGSEYQLEFDTVILAIGQVVDKEIAARSGVRLSAWQTMEVDRETGCTSEPGVFAAGDCVSGAATAVEAIAGARKAARAINSYLAGATLIPEEKPFNCSMGKLHELNPADLGERERIARTPEVHTSPMERVKTFSEFNLGLSREGVNQEVKRCLSCGCEDVFNCTLRKLATEYQVDTQRLGVSKKRYKINHDHRFVNHDANKCVLCGNCVRICQEVQAIGALGFVNRGYDTVVKPAMGLPLAETMCESCGQCVSACPTGALAAVSPFAKPGPFRSDAVVSTTCVQCSTGCALELHVVGDKIARVTSPLRGEVNHGNLCKKGAFEFRFVHSSGRLKSPLRRNGEKMQEVSWEEAIGSAAAMLEKISSRYGSDSIGVLVSPALSNEENYLAQKLARLALQTNNIDSTRPVAAEYLVTAVIPQTTNISYNDLMASDFILVINTDPTVDYPIIAQKIRQAVAKGGKLAVVSPQATRLDPQATLTVRTNPWKMLKLLQAIQAYLQRYELVTGDFGLPLSEDEIKHRLLELPGTVRVKPAKVIEFLHLYLRARKPVVVVDGEALNDSEMTALLEIAQAIGGNKRGQGVLQLFEGGNSRGQLEMGVHPRLLPGGKKMDDLAARMDYYQETGLPLPSTAGMTLPQQLAAAKNGDLLGMLIIGDDFSLDYDIFDEGMFTVVVASTWRADLCKADIILPAATFAETRGTVTNSEGRIQQLNPAFLPPAGKDNLSILCELAKALSIDVERGIPEQTFGEKKNCRNTLGEKEGDLPINQEKKNQKSIPVNI